MKRTLFIIFLLIILVIIIGCDSPLDDLNDPKIPDPIVPPDPIPGVNIYYVSNDSSSEDWEGALDIEKPCTVETAMESAEAGDTVYFLAGTYNTTPRPPEKRPHYHARWEPANSGASGAPITFAAYPGSEVIINGQIEGDTTDENSSPDLVRVFSTGRQDYIIFDGFTVQANSGDKMGSIIIGYDINDESQTSDNCIIRNCIINGGSNIIECGDNRECIRIEWSTNTLVQNCKIINVRQKDNWHNTSGIKMYHNWNTTIENCEISNCTLGIYDKSSGVNSTFRYNYIHDCYQGIGTQGFAWHNEGREDTISSHPDMKIYHNVVANCDYACFTDVREEWSSSDGMEIYNNTFYSGNKLSASVCLSGGDNKKFYNNIMYGLRKDGDLALLRFFSHNNNQAVPVEITACDHNQFGDIDGNFLIRVHYTYDGDYLNYSTLSDWKNSGVLADGSNPGEGSLASNPEFSNFSSNMSVLDDFILADNSPCKGAGRDGKDMGADIDRVGIQ